MAKEARLNFRIDDGDYAALADLAEKDRRKIVDYVRLILAEHVKSARQKQKLKA